MHLKIEHMVDCMAIGWWTNPPVATRKLLHAGGVAEIRLLKEHDKMNE